VIRRWVLCVNLQMIIRLKVNAMREDTTEGPYYLKMMTMSMYMRMLFVIFIHSFCDCND